MSNNTTYEGWKNRGTWSVSLWINNEEPLYRAACDFMRSYKGRRPYAAFIHSQGMADERNGDNFKWLSTRLCYRELNEMMRDLSA
jgi:hypothetical protein